jgi:hypothetical protein
MATRRPKRAKPPIPRAPLPRQTGGVHEDKTKRPWRRRKHKGKLDETLDKTLDKMHDD